MPCHWENVPGLGWVHMNVAAPRKRKCAHCGCPDAKTLCDWPMDRPVRFYRIEDLSIGDVIVQRHGWRGRIAAIELPATVRAEVITRGDRAQPLLHRVESMFALDEWLIARLRVERPGTCDKPCCFRCRRHVGPDRDYCLDHWNREEKAS